MSSQIPLWGRSWKLTIKSIVGGQVSTNTQLISQSQWEPESLRLTFDVLETFVDSPFWYADISVYNLNQPDRWNLIENAVWATLEAGYQAQVEAAWEANGQAINTIIWDGPILQVLLDRENVVDTKVTFHCCAYPPVWEYGNLVFGAVNAEQGGPWSSQADVVAQMSNQIGAPTPRYGGYAQSMMQNKVYPRGKTWFGSLPHYMSQMANDQFLQQWQKGQQQFISDLTTSPTPNLVYSPPFPPNWAGGPSKLDPSITYSIIGTPRNTSTGVIFSVLLDPRLKVDLPPMVVKIDNAVISQVKISLGQFPTPLDKDGLYVVSQVRHVGDTRGNDWMTEVTAVARAYTSGLLDGLFNALNQGGPA